MGQMCGLPKRCDRELGKMLTFVGAAKVNTAEMYFHRARDSNLTNCLDLNTPWYADYAFRCQHMGKHRGARHAALDGSWCRGSLDQLLATHAAHLRAHVPDQPISRGRSLEHLGDIFSDASELAAAGWAGTSTYGPKGTTRWRSDRADGLPE